MFFVFVFFNYFIYLFYFIFTWLQNDYKMTCGPPILRLPTVIFNIIASFASIRARLLTIEHVSNHWHRLSSQGGGWSDSLDLTWLLFKSEPTSMRKARLIDLKEWSMIITHLSKRLAQVSRLSTLRLPFSMCAALYTIYNNKALEPWSRVRHLELIYDNNDKVYNAFDSNMIETLFPHTDHLTIKTGSGVTRGVICRWRHPWFI